MESWPRSIGTALSNALGTKAAAISTSIAFLAAFIPWAITAFGQLLGKTWKLDVHPAFFSIIAALGVLLFFVGKHMIELHRQAIPKFGSPELSSYTDPKHARGKARRTFKIRVPNDSSTHIQNGFVKLEELTNRSGEESKEHGQPFKRTLDRASPLIVSNQKFFDLAPNDWIDIDLVGFDETDNSTHVHMNYALDRDVDRDIYTEVPVSLCPHRMTVRIGANNSTPIFRTYSFNVDPRGYLCVDEVT